MSVAVQEVEEDSIRDTSHTGMHEDANGGETSLIAAAGNDFGLVVFLRWLPCMHVDLHGTLR